MTNSHETSSVPEPAVHAVAADPVSAAVGGVVLVAAVVASAKRRWPAVDDASLVERARVARRSPESQRRVEWRTESMRGW